ncbi:MAG TPA: mannosyltransferase family protein [Pirellulales bacterium]|jgi:hypothetical protein|nr:mannosyltransferase family protein [Pirellulales bacterium]
MTRGPLLQGCLVFALAATIVDGAIEMGRERLCGEPTTWPECCARFDGTHYRELAERGYRYDPTDRSPVAFFPLYPLLVREVAAWTGLATLTAGVVVSHALLLLALLGLAFYWRVAVAEVADDEVKQEQEADPPSRRRRSEARRACWIALFLIALGPASLFYYVVYTEALFLFCAVAALWGMRRQWPNLAIALTIGAATATRSVGVALLLPFALYLLQQAPPGWRRWRALAVWLPVACWGLLGYMAFQSCEFGDPLAFAKTQQFWQVRPALPPLQKGLALLTLEPIWNVYRSAQPGNWQTLGSAYPWFNFQFWNPILLLLTAGLVVCGAVKGWLNRFEVAYAAGVLLIPYLAKGYENAMLSHARFALLAFPAALVAGRLLAKLPWPVFTLILLGAAAEAAIFSFLFAGGRPVF